MAFKDDMKQLAVDMLSELGEAVTVSRSNASSFNPATGTVTESAATTYSALSHPSFFAKEYVDGVAILSTDIRLLIYSTTIPLAGDVFTLSSAEYTAISIQQIRAQGSNIVYIAQLRK